MTEDPRLATVFGFENELFEGAVERVDRWRWGTALFTPSLRRAYSHNFLLLDDKPEVDASAIIKEADRVQGAAGLLHRRVYVPEERLGRKLEAGFRTAGWRVSRLVVMVVVRPPDRTVDTSSVVELNRDEYTVLRRKWLAATYDEETSDQLARRHMTYERAVDVTYLGAPSDGEIVSSTQLYSGDDVAQIEEVETLEAQRGKGLARAVIARAIGLAGDRLVFLFADDEDWPKALYSKLGFDEIGRAYDFVRPAEDDPENA